MVAHLPVAGCLFLSLSVQVVFQQRKAALELQFVLVPAQV